MKLKKLAAALCTAALSLTVMSVTAFAADGVNIEETFTDENFRTYVSENCDTDGDGVLSADEIAEVTYIDCSYSEIGSLEGIENFTALEYLYCNGNKLTELDVSGFTELTTLSCGGNQLTELDVSQNTALKYLSCGSNQLTTLDVTANTALLQAVPRWRA